LLDQAGVLRGRRAQVGELGPDEDQVVALGQGLLDAGALAYLLSRAAGGGELADEVVGVGRLGRRLGRVPGAEIGTPMVPMRLPGRSTYVALATCVQSAAPAADCSFAPTMAEAQSPLRLVATFVMETPIAVKLGGNNAASVSGWGSVWREAMSPYGPRPGLGELEGLGLPDDSPDSLGFGDVCTTV
jgi:hypothetical protein